MRNLALDYVHIMVQPHPASVSQWAECLTPALWFSLQISVRFRLDQHFPSCVQQNINFTGF